MTGKREFTIDEWFYHLLAKEDTYRDVAGLLIKIFEICDKITLQQGSNLARKFHQLDEESAKWSPNQRTVAKFIKQAFLSNSNKINWVEERSLLTPELEEQLPRKDIYLVNICLQTKDKLLITTDQKLHDQLLTVKESLNITPVMLSVFSNLYMQDKWV